MTYTHSSLLALSSTPNHLLDSLILYLRVIGYILTVWFKYVSTRWTPTSCNGTAHHCYYHVKGGYMVDKHV